MCRPASRHTSNGIAEDEGSSPDQACALSLTQILAKWDPEQTIWAGYQQILGHQTQQERALALLW